MQFKKVLPPQEESIGALLEVHAGQNEQHLVEWLRNHGVSEIESLAPGFLSVVASADTLRRVESMARVEIKRRKAMR